MRRVALLLAMLLIWVSAPLAADERILEFHADLRVLDSGAMEVEETIRVRAEGNRIKRGIYRDFPTDYRGRFGEMVRVEFEVAGVLRDGDAEGWFTESLANGVRVYIGRKQVMLDPGVYEYTLRYRTDRQLGFFEDHDELYWNVTGNGWDFPIDSAAATVRLPAGIPPEQVRVEAYTGAQGARGQDYQVARGYDDSAVFRTTRPLAPRQGLTIVVTWPKGFVAEPSRLEQVGYLLRQNAHLLVTGVGLLVLAAFYLGVWYRVGRDPAAGAIIPIYQPPQGYSPASMRYVRRMGYDHTSFAAAIVNLAVKGYLEIEDNDGDYTLRRRDGGDAELAAGESALLKKLFAAAGSVKLKQANHRRIRAAIDAHKGSLARDYETRYFVTNRGWAILGVVMTLATFTIGTLLLPASGAAPGAAFMVLWLSGWTLGVFFLLRQIVVAWRQVGRGKWLHILPAIFITLFAMPFVGGELVGIYFLGESAGWAMVVLLVLAIAINFFFYEWLKAPTLAGRRLLDQVDGFAQYLAVAEGDELKLAGAPDRTPDLYERYLPYALALGVEQQWSDKFAAVLAAAAVDGQSYHPGWYRGGGFDVSRVGGFASGLGSSLSGAVASSSSAPGSSSGSGGGGSSGGGGGGGGGGGW